jgi:uridine phosphorylase
VERLRSVSPLLVRSDHREPSVFTVENLLREGRRQLQRPEGVIPRVCLLDPDGDIERHLLRTGAARRSPVWACYHTELHEFEGTDATIGIVGCAVGAPFAVLVAEEMFASGCELLISLTSAGRIAPEVPNSCIVVFERALRGEGTSHAYLPPSEVVTADPGLVAMARDVLARLDTPLLCGATWTTDAPFRETATSIERAAADGALVVEMEAAALYAYARAGCRQILCLGQVTNNMAVEPGDFEKGASNGADRALAIVDALASAFLHRQMIGVQHE